MGSVTERFMRSGVNRTYVDHRTIAKNDSFEETRKAYGIAGVLFHEDLGSVYRKIDEEWIHGDLDWNGNGELLHHLFDGSGGFITTNHGKRRDEIPYSIKFVAATEENLEKITKGLGLPFDSDAVKSSG